MRKLLTFDAFNTLFYVHPNPGLIYTRVVAQELNLNLDPLAVQFQLASQLSQKSKSHPNFTPNPHEWWKDVVYYTLEPFVPLNILNLSFPLLFQRLFTTFATNEPYQLYPDVQETLSILSKNTNISLGVLSNSDSRTLSILKDFKLDSFFNFILTSHECGCMKPDSRIFHLAKEKSELKQPFTSFHVGDDLEKDVKAAENAGWIAFYLRRQPNNDPIDFNSSAQTIKSLKELPELLK
jgi:putative hydrolase of the HAD superfamily